MNGFNNPPAANFHIVLKAIIGPRRSFINKVGSLSFSMAAPK
jgi:hypothetical protein